MNERTMMNTVKVKFGAEPNHSHDGRQVKAGEIVELPEDLAAFVIEQKKAVRWTDGGDPSQN